MEVGDGLPAILPAVGHHAESSGQTEGTGQLPDRPVHRRENLGVAGGGVGQSGNVPAGDHQDVYRGLRVQVTEGHHLLVLMDEGGGDGSLGDLAEDTIRRGEWRY